MVGYRYYETRFEDVQLGQGNAGDFDYDQEVVFPFGYGLSYTTFEWSDFKATWNDRDCTVTVNVANTGDVAGKDVVELYFQSPYTEYDKANGIEKPAVELAGYAKTDLLAPGESQTVEITMTEEQLRAFDAKGAGTYILDAGTYYLTAGRNSHDAIQNILSVKTGSADGNASMAAEYIPENPGGCRQQRGNGNSRKKFFPEQLPGNGRVVQEGPDEGRPLEGTTLAADGENNGGTH